MARTLSKISRDINRGRFPSAQFIEQESENSPILVRYTKPLSRWQTWRLFWILSGTGNRERTEFQFWPSEEACVLDLFGFLLFLQTKPCSVMASIYHRDGITTMMLGFPLWSSRGVESLIPIAERFVKNNNLAADIVLSDDNFVSGLKFSFPGYVSLSPVEGCYDIPWLIETIRELALQLHGHVDTLVINIPNGVPDLKTD